jgi:hypothetical protein
MLRSHFISSPVRVENTPAEIVVETIMLDIWLPLKCRLNSLETARSRGKSRERLTPYRIEQRYVAATYKWHTASRVEIIPEISWLIISVVNFQLSFPFIYPNTKRNTVLRVQKIEVNMTASALL